MADLGVDDVLYMADGREAIAARSPDPAAAPDYLTAPDLGTFAARDGMPGTKQIPASSDPYIGGLQFSDRYVWDFGSGPHILTYYLKDSANRFWTSQQKDAFKSAMQEISNAVDLQFVEVDNEADASLIEILDNDTNGALHYIPNSSTTQLVGEYNIFTQAPNSDIYAGSYDYNTFIHEVGHALGLKHPFESEGDQSVFPGGQDGNYEDLGNNNFIHTMYAAMAYASDYGFNASGAVELNNSFYVNNQYDYGYMQTPGTFDIVALQYYYGANTTYQSGNTLYTLPDVVGSPNVGAAWVTIYDAGGVDEIRYTGTKNAFIDLRAATADDTPTGGGMFSQVANVYGGFNIAKGILIENARGGSGDDSIVGNALGNRIVGGGGHDTIVGGGGTDIYAGAAADVDGDVIQDFEQSEYIHITDATEALTNLSFAGSTLSFENNGTTVSLTVQGAGTADPVKQKFDSSGGIDIYFGATASYGISVSRSSLAEGNTGSGNDLVYTVTRTTDQSAATIDVGLEGTATVSGGPGADYSVTGLSNGQLVFAVGELTATFTVTTVPDTAIELNETVVATISNASDGGMISTGRALGTIVNDDVAPPVEPPAAPPFVPPSIDDPTPADSYNEAQAGASVTIFFTGAVPTQEKQAELNAFVARQYEAYEAAGVANPALGPFEALGRGFSETPEFATKYGAQSEADFIAASYAEVFGHAPTTAQQTHFQAQIDYFELIYESAGISSTQADLFAKGAALGQMIGHATLEGVSSLSASRSVAADMGWADV